MEIGGVTGFGRSYVELGRAGGFRWRYADLGGARRSWRI